MSLYPAIDILKLTEYGGLQGRKYGLLTHVAAGDMNLTPTYALLAASNTPPKALFSPEHGLMATAPDGAHVGHSIEPHTGLPVHSLYGESKKPAPEMFDGIDLMVIDLVDVGSRFYTYIWSLALMLESCGENQIEVVVLDRPNPLGGLRVSGMYGEPDCTSFVGLYPKSLPITHGMTFGEIARLFNAEINPSRCVLNIVAVSGWNRGKVWEDTGLTWVLPSPAMPSPLTARHYSGAALIEGTTLSEGRGTTLPFEVVGAPGIDGFKLAKALNNLPLAGVRFRPHAFRPTSSKYAGEDCQGVQAHITDLNRFDALHVWLNVIITIRAEYPDVFKWLDPVGENQHFDLLIGNKSARQMIDNGATANDVLANERTTIAHFEERRKPYLMYG